VLPWLAALAGVVLVLVAAKAHGRQLRLERTALGLGGDVDFRAPPPAVAVIWRRDRVRYWVALPVLALALLAVGALLGASLPTVLLLSAVLAPTLAFSALGLDSFLRHPQPPETRLASGAWWIGVLGAVGVWLMLLLV
jgi:hypothetical protein